MRLLLLLLLLLLRDTHSVNLLTSLDAMSSAVSSSGDRLSRGLYTYVFMNVNCFVPG
jgi:hypothetical protein